MAGGSRFAKMVVGACVVDPSSLSGRLAVLAIEAALDSVGDDLVTSLIGSYRAALEVENEELGVGSVRSYEASDLLCVLYCEARPNLHVDVARERFCDDGIVFPTGEVPREFLDLLAAAMARRDEAEDRALYAAARA